MPKAVVFDTPINELNSWSFVADPLTKDDGTPLGPSAVATLTLTLYDEKTNTIINSVDHMNIKNANRGALDVNGRLVVSLISADNVILGSASTERHRALIIATWDVPNGYSSQEIIFTVINVNKVP